MKMINVLYVFFLTLSSAVLCERLHDAGKTRAVIKVNPG